MSYDLTGEKISFTYGRVVQVVSGSYYDGFGNPLPIGTSSVVITGSLSGYATTGSNTFIGNQIISGSLIVTNGITGSLYGTSSYSLNSISASYALTASYSNTSSYSNNSNSSSYSLTASYALNGFSLTTGSTYPITSSWSNNTISSSYSLTSSYSNNSTSASYAPTNTNITASWSINSVTASYVVTAQTASYYGGSVVSSSYALTASYALNGGSGGTTLITGSTYPITSSWANNVVSASYALTASYCLNSSNAVGTDAISGSFSSSSIWEFTHSLNANPILVQAYDTNFNQIIPQNIFLLNSNVVRLSFPVSASGYAIAARSGIQIISSSVGTGLITGSTYPITSSWANNVISSSYSLTSSYSSNSTTASYSLTASYYGGSVISSSYALTSSYSTTSSYSNASISSSYTLSASYAPTDTNITASWSINSLTASYYGGNVISSSYSDFAFSSLNTQDTLVYVKNTSGAIIPKGKVVRITGADNSSNFGTIGLADYANDNNSANTLGFTNESFAINAFGYVMTNGYLLAVNTNGFTSGDLLFLSSSGDYTNVVPTAPKHGVRLGQVIRVQSNNGSIYVRIDNGAELGELHDVIDSTTTGSHGDLLIKSGSVWINSKNLTGSYILSGSLTTNDGIVANSVTASFYGTSSWSNNTISSSYSTTASYVILAQSASYYAGSVTSASYALSASFSPVNTNITASWSNNSLTASYVTLAQSASYYNGSVISSSYSLSSSYAPINTNITTSWSNNSLTASSINFTASNATLSQTASYIINAQSASYYGGSVTSASYSLSASFAPTNTNITSSWSINSLTSSYVVNAQSASYYGGNVTSSSYSTTSSYSNSSISSSYSLSASYAPVNTNITASWSTNSLTASSINFTASNAILAQTASYYGGSVTSASYSLSASYAPTNNNLTASYAILTSVSMSLNFVDDTAAAAGGVPLGGLYRNGNFILIRLT